ncbi:STAS domain-containing protein [Roseovarius tibetensis]|uniref:STAS domain-containing protein n=1 Tax=Roseovarius tibetensis TaxID=2685897 RepID=UPI003D7FD8E0
MELSTTLDGTTTVVHVNAARIDAAAAIAFKDALREAVAQGSDDVVLDLGEVTFVDSSGLGAIVAAMKNLGHGRRLDLAGLTPDVAKVFRLTRMDTVFVIHDRIDHLSARAPG